MVRKHTAPFMSSRVLVTALRSLEIYNTPNAASTEAIFYKKIASNNLIVYSMLHGE
jgi:hypothetical protein